MPSSRPISSPDSAGPAARLAGRLWVERDGETYLAWGRVVLLERVREYGSISQAARSMGMGYRHAWRLIDQVNRQAPVPLVERAAGGRGGGGTRLTLAGERAIAQFWEAVRDFHRFLDSMDPPGVYLVEND